MLKVLQSEKKKEKKNISLNAPTCNAQIKRDEDDSSEHSSKDKEMRLFVRRYNKYIRKNDPKHSDIRRFITASPGTRVSCRGPSN